MKQQRGLKRPYLKQQYENVHASVSESLDVYLKHASNLDTHVVVWMNKSDFDTMGLDDLYNNFKIVEQKIKRSTGAINDEKNLIFLTTTGRSSINNINTIIPEVSTGTTKFKKILSNFMMIDLEEMDSKWNIALLEHEGKKFLSRTGRKIIIDGKATLLLRINQLECFYCHKWDTLPENVRAPEE
ncbi:hypothetical protein Tco_0286348 [Tanacetum coccineum]